MSVGGSDAPRSPASPRSLDAPPSGPARTRALATIGLWCVAQFAVPLRYYAPGADAYDERFAWRMFSAVRVQTCSVEATETVDTTPRALSLMSVLPAPWVSLLQRNRPAVVRAALAWRCAAEDAPSEVRLVSDCADASGDWLPRVTRAMRCAGRTVIEETAAARDASGDGAR